VENHPEPDQLLKDKKKDPKKDQRKAQQKETNKVGRTSHVSQKSEDKSRK
jgi:hypothetical protein